MEITTMDDIFAEIDYDNDFEDKSVDAELYQKKIYEHEYILKAVHFIDIDDNYEDIVSRYKLIIDYMQMSGVDIMLDDEIVFFDMYNQVIDKEKTVKKPTYKIGLFIGFSGNMKKLVALKFISFLFDTSYNDICNHFKLKDSLSRLDDVDGYSTYECTRTRNYNLFKHIGLSNTEFYLDYGDHHDIIKIDNYKNKPIIYIGNKSDAVALLDIILNTLCGESVSFYEDYALICLGSFCNKSDVSRGRRQSVLVDMGAVELDFDECKPLGEMMILPNDLYINKDNVVKYISGLKKCRCIVNDRYMFFILPDVIKCDIKDSVMPLCVIFKVLSHISSVSEMLKLRSSDADKIDDMVLMSIKLEGK